MNQSKLESLIGKLIYEDVYYDNPLIVNMIVGFTPSCKSVYVVNVPVIREPPNDNHNGFVKIDVDNIPDIPTSFKGLITLRIKEELINYLHDNTVSDIQSISHLSLFGNKHESIKFIDDVNTTFEWSDY